MLQDLLTAKCALHYSIRRKEASMTKLCREVWIEVNLDAIKKNLRAIRHHIPKRPKLWLS